MALGAVRGGREAEVVLGGGRRPHALCEQRDHPERVRATVRALGPGGARKANRARDGNDLSRAGVTRSWSRPRATAARLQPEIPDLLPLPGPRPTERSDADDAATAALDRTPAQGGGPRDETCAPRRLTAAGIYQTGRGRSGITARLGALAMANIGGLFAYHREPRRRSRSRRSTAPRRMGRVGMFRGRGRQRRGAVRPRRRQGGPFARARSRGSPEATRWCSNRPRSRISSRTRRGSPSARSSSRREGAFSREDRDEGDGRREHHAPGRPVPSAPLGSPFDSEGMPTLPTTLIERGVAKSRGLRPADRGQGGARDRPATACRPRIPGAPWRAIWCWRAARERSERAGPEGRARGSW